MLVVTVVVLAVLYGSGGYIVCDESARFATNLDFVLKQLILRPFVLEPILVMSAYKDHQIVTGVLKL